MFFLLLETMAALYAMAAFHASLIAVKVALLYASLSFALVGIAYLLRQPGWVLKQGSGKLSPLAWLLYGPFLLINGLLFHAQKLVSKETPFDEIVPGLHLGRMLTSSEVEKLPMPVAATVDLTCEFNELRSLRELSGYLQLPVLDGTAPTEKQLRAGAEHIENHLTEGTVYVHCALGHGRSATVVAAYLLLSGKASTVEQAITLVRNKRRGIGLKAVQVSALQSLLPD